MHTPNHVWIKYPKMLEDKIQHGSLILDFDPSYKPEWNSILHGEVFSVPEKNDFRIQDKLQVGDKVYFHYLEADEENMLEEDGNNYLKIAMNNIFCYVRDGKIIPYGGYVLSKSIYDDDVEQVEVDGAIIPAKLSKSGLVVDIDIDHRENFSKIHYIGLPLAGEETLDVSIGDVVAMESQCHHKYEIEGIEYFVFHQEHLMAVVDAG